MSYVFFFARKDIEISMKRMLCVKDKVNNRKEEVIYGNPIRKRTC